MKAKFGAIVVDGRGKAGGHVFSKNRGGSYMRTKVTPSNPQSSAQASVRSRLTEFAQKFRSLTALQIAGWNAAVDSFKSTDIFGDIKNPSGINLYVRLNTNLGLVAASSIDDAPLPSEVPALTTLTATATAGTPTLSVVFAPSPVPADTSLVIKASKQLSPGVSNVKGKTTVVAVKAAASTTPANILSAYVAKYGTLVAGQKIALEAYQVNEITGQKGQSLHYQLIVGA